MGFSSGLLTCLLLINLITLGAMLLDEAVAKAHGPRISELTIFILSLIGGVWGTIVGMLLFYHKPLKIEFQPVTTFHGVLESPSAVLASSVDRFKTARPVMW